VRAIVKEKHDEKTIFILMEDLIDDPRERLGAYLHLRVGTIGLTSVPNTYVQMRSSCVILRSPSSLLRRHAYLISANQETVENIEYSNLRECSSKIFAISSGRFSCIKPLIFAEILNALAYKYTNADVSHVSFIRIKISSHRNSTEQMNHECQG
jgi:hypothetical protein